MKLVPLLLILGNSKITEKMQAVDYKNIIYINIKKCLNITQSAWNYMANVSTQM